MAARVRDPICGMEIAPEEAADSAVHGGRTYYFCSPACAERFRLEPETFAAPQQEPLPLSSQDAPEPAESAAPPVRPSPGVVPSATTGFPEGARKVRVDLPIQGLDCPVCADNLRRALLALPGVERAAVNPATHVATVAYHRDTTDLADLSRTVRSAGYQVGLATARLGIAGLS